jgi:hypothetical protein
LIFVPDPNTTGADYASFTFRVSDGANLSNVGTAAVIVKAKSSQPIGETNAAAPTIDAAVITTQAKEPENAANTTVQLFSDIDLFDDSGKLTKAVVSLSGGSPATGEDVLSVTGLPAGITASLYDATNRTITLIGEASVQAYKTALELIQYTNTVNSVSKADRTVTVAIEDGLNPAVSASYTLKVAADDDAIEIKNADTSLLSVTESPADSLTNPISQLIFADSGGTLTFVDPDTAGTGSAVISNLEVSISNGFQAGDDSLVFSASTGITFSLGGQTLTLSPSGTSATAQQYVDALKTIKFENASDTPDQSTRQISIKINGGASSTVRSINVSATNDPPDIATSSIVETSYSVPNTSPLTFNVSDLLTDAGATDRDSSPLSLEVTATSTGGAPSGTWSYSENGTTFTNLTGGTQAVSSSGQLRFSGATSAGTSNPSLSFKASDGSASSSGTATLSFPLQNSGVTRESGMGADSGGIDANSSGKVTIVYDAITDRLDTITNFDPTVDVIRFKGSAFGAVSSSWDENKVIDANATTNTSTQIAEADIIFFRGNDGSIDTYLSNVALQPSTILVQRKTITAEDIFVWYIQDGATPTKTSMAYLGNLSTSTTNPTLAGADANAKWNSFIANGAQAFEVVV